MNGSAHPMHACTLRRLSFYHQVKKGLPEEQELNEVGRKRVS
jgi:hypothetical protein